MCHEQHPSVSPSVCLSVCLSIFPILPSPGGTASKGRRTFHPQDHLGPWPLLKSSQLAPGARGPKPALHHQPLGTQLSTSKKKNPIFFPHPVNGGEILPMPTAKAPLFLRRLLGFFPASSAQPESFPELPSILFLLCENRIKITV